MYMPENLDEPAPKKVYTVIPAGTVAEAEVIAAAEKLSSGGKNQIELTFCIVGPEFAKRRIFHLLCWEDGRRDQSKAACKAMGVAIAAGKALLPEAFMGRRALITLGVEVYNGKEKNKIAWDGVAPAAPADGTPVDAGDVLPEEEIPF